MPTMHTHTITRRLPAILVAALVLAACGKKDDGASAGATTATSTGTTAAAGPTTAAAPAMAPVSQEDALAFMAASDSGEIATSTIAQKKGTSAEVKSFAQEMIREHRKMLQEGAALGKKLGVTPAPGELAMQAKAMGDSMTKMLDSTKKGADFDRAYIDGQVRAHEATLQHLQHIDQMGTTGGAAAGAGATGAAAAGATGAAKSGAAGAATTVQEQARMAIPKVQAHLDKARQIQQKLPQGGAPGTAPAGTTGH
jgi:putative membrane protein